ncbi:hypothetical protein M1O57_05170 [Dehalococcoidia bacterium]|nr:hypothetical protein [Dehalococcoidia bacterium]MCL0079178.1 hypothetical protein [Dehalococcoidia bacterium]MCL0104960.1 hypothetical protein [Dehalococcoidia bacterium]
MDEDISPKTLGKASQKNLTRDFPSGTHGYRLRVNDEDAIRIVCDIYSTPIIVTDSPLNPQMSGGTLCNLIAERVTSFELTYIRWRKEGTS